MTATIIGLAAILAPAGGASANDGDCGPGDFCLWEDPGMSGGRWDDSGYVSDYTSGNRWWGTTRTIQDQSSAAKSRYSFWVVKLCEHTYFRGRDLKFYPGGEIGNLADYDFNDLASSNYY